MMNDLGIKVTEEQAKIAFKKLDRDGSGQVEIDEFGYWWDRRTKAVFEAETQEDVVEEHDTAGAQGRSKELDGLKEELEEANGSLVLLQEHIDELEAEKSESTMLIEQLQSKIETLRELSDGNEKSTADRFLELQTDLEEAQEKADSAAKAAEKERSVLEAKVEQLENSLGAYVSDDQQAAASVESKTQEEDC